MKQHVSKLLKINLAIFMAMFSLQMNAQTLPGKYTTSWVGNTFVPATNSYNFVQGWANSMYVDADGTIFTNSFWDEAAKELGIYKNGLCTGMIQNQHEHADGGGITANANFVWATVHEGKISRFNRPGYSENGTEFTASTATIKGLVANATELFVSDYAGGKIKVYSTTSHGSLLRSWSVTRPGPLAMDALGNIWVLTYDVNAWGPGTGACIKAYSPTGTLLKTVSLAAGVEAKSIAIDLTNNELLVTDIGVNMQIHIYNNINDTPALAQSFGTQGGILSGTKGLGAPLKFNVPNLVGVDASHNIIVWSNGNNTDIDKPIDADGMGSCVESYTRAGSRNWQILGLEFVDMGTFDPTTDGANLYTKHEHFTMDYSKPDGQQWTWKGWTLDRTTYANSDIRTKNDGGHLASPMMRRLNGNLYMYLNSMSGGGFSFFRYTPDNEIAIPCGELRGQSQWNDANGNGQKDTGETTSNVLWQYDMFGNYVDNKGDIWYVYDDIRNHTLKSITNGVPIYNLIPTIITTPAPFNSLRRIQYDSDNDIMYLSGYTAAKPYTNDWKSCGLVMARYNNWSNGNRIAAYSINLPTLAADGSNMVSLTVEKDYIFVVGVQTRAKVWVYNSSTGALVGTMVPGANVGGIEKTGWCDIVNSIAAFKTSSGQYLVNVEEDFFEKILIYRWCPTGECKETDMKVSLTSPEPGKIYFNNTQLILKAEVTKDTSEVSKVEFLINDTIIGQSTIAPFQVEWNNPYLGDIRASAKVTSTKAATAYSPIVRFKITDSTPKVEFLLKEDVYSILDTVYLNATVTSFVGAIESVLFYVGDSILFEDKDFPYSHKYSGLKEGTWPLKVKVVDNSGKFSWSETISITVPIGIREPFGGVIRNIPEQIEAEDFDDGPKGLAFYDTDITNNGEQFRPTSEVDIEVCTDVNGGFDVGWTSVGEWLKYSVNVEAGLYDITARIACPDGGSEFQLLLDNKIVTTFNIPKTGDWNIWRDVNNLDISLNAGNKKTLQMLITKPGFNFNYFKFRKVIPVETFKITTDTLELLKQGSATLNLELLPANTTRPGVIWTVANTSLVTVDALGKVTAKSIVGTTSIYAISVDGIHKDSCIVNVSSPTGIADLSADELAVRVYPNPATNNVVIDFNNMYGQAPIVVKIIDILGKKVYESGSVTHDKQLNINTISFKSGVYLINVQIGTQSVKRKLIIRKN